MTDKTPKNKAETLVNTPTTFASTTGTVSGSEPKSRALPQADALKARFKAGSIPLQTDFADLVDLANMGRQAVGGAKGQSGPANGFTLSPEGRLELKPNTDKGISVDRGGVAVKVDESKGVQVNHSGISVKLSPDQGLEFVQSGIQIKVNKFKGVSIGSDGVGVQLYPDRGLEHDPRGLWVKANGSKGVEVNQDGVAVKVNSKRGLQVDNSGVGVKLYPDWGLGHDPRGLWVKVNSSKGVVVNSSGIAINPGSGIQVGDGGVSIKLSEKSNLISDELNGVSLNLPVGFGFLAKTDFNPNGKIQGGWSQGAKISQDDLTYNVWIRVS